VLVQMVSAASDNAKIIQNRGTVAALATAVVPQAGGVAIVRMSGPEAVRIARDVFQPGQPKKQRPDKSRDAWELVSHMALYGGVYDTKQELIDEVRRPKSFPLQLSTLSARSAPFAAPSIAYSLHSIQVLVLPMLAPRSYTKEDVIEIHCHGGSICARSVLQTCMVRRCGALALEASQRSVCLILHCQPSLN
jgi:tRNA modification GTPase